ncbi:hypothetical protein CLIB1423_12S01354 [[Candida] railenensis]|uniref:5'-3' DNA helicase ZGRF1-like N-terminal domain-containing protein n=1 Tax=[Candida] railenensis TaxID=45579 RepID=A0A9P0QQM6_9ASCO|nr:hypothetical protein CLIB1423_12S01354 [[Candida] railenensis]
MTSIVKEFSVLYSNRVHQKTKNWKDGNLKYYLFNNRIDVHSESGEMIASDFFPPNKSREKIEEEYLSSGNQFKLPNAPILVEIDEKTGEYERDISIMFKKKKAAAPSSDKRDSQRSTPGASKEVSIKYESDGNVIIPKSSFDKPLSPTTPPTGVKRRPVGLSKRGATERRKNIKVEQHSNTKSESSNIISANVMSHSKEHEPGPGPGPGRRPPVRIPVNSSSIFKHLRRVSDGANPGITNSDYPAVKQETTPLVMYPETISTSNADIIYDLSDLEEDLEFNEMIKRSRQ